MATLALEPASQLGRVRRLARALQTGHEHHRGRLRAVGDADGLAAEGAGQLLVDDLDDLLAGVERLRDLLPQRPLTDPGDEPLDDGEVDVGLEQGETDLAHRVVDIGLGELALAAEASEDAFETIGECFEHGGFQCG